MRTTARRRTKMAAAFVVWPSVMAASLLAVAWGFQHHVNTAVWAFLVSTATFVVIFLLELAMPAVSGWTLLRDRQSVNDIGHGILVGGVSRPLATPVTVALVGLVIAVGDDARAAGPWPHRWPLVAQVALGLFVWSFTNYWTHRTFHRVERLWWFHALHHDPTRMQLLKGNRIHVAEDMASYIVMLAPLLAAGAPERVLLWIAMWNNVEGTLAHSNVDMRFPAIAHVVLPTPQNHRVHHAGDRALQDSNFGGITPLWDILFRTYRHPDRHPVTGFGLGDGSVAPRSFVAQLAFPFRTTPASSLAIDGN